MSHSDDSGAVLDVVRDVRGELAYWQSVVEGLIGGRGSPSSVFTSRNSDELAVNDAGELRRILDDAARKLADLESRIAGE